MLPPDPPIVLDWQLVVEETPHAGRQQVGKHDISKQNSADGQASPKNKCGNQVPDYVESDDRAREPASPTAS
jgi:hypothetical protein